MQTFLRSFAKSAQDFASRLPLRSFLACPEQLSLRRRRRTGLLNGSTSGDAATLPASAARQTHALTPLARRTRQTCFEDVCETSCRNLPIHISQCRETKNLTYGLPRCRSPPAGKVPNGVRWKNLLRLHLPSPLLPETSICSLANRARDFSCGLPLSLTPANRLNLELAKGFEPLTL